jgi:hypothetical protein
VSNPGHKFHDRLLECKCCSEGVSGFRGGWDEGLPLRWLPLEDILACRILDRDPFFVVECDCRSWRWIGFAMTGFGTGLFSAVMAEAQ